MSEWGVVGVIITLLGLLTAILCLADRITKPIKELTVSVATLTATMENLNYKLSKLDKDNEEEHLILWDKFEKHDETINDHEVRIQLIEHK